MRGNSSRTVELQNIIIPRQDLLGAEGEQIWYIFNIVAPYFLIAMMPEAIWARPVRPSWKPRTT